MRKKIMSYYLWTVIIAVLSAVAATVLIVFAVSVNRTPNNDLPQYYIHDLQQQIEEKDGEFVLSDEAVRKIRDNAYWMQILNEDGKSIFDENTPSDIPEKYSNIELVNMVSESDGLEGYTVFMTEYQNQSDGKKYDILLGCRTDVVRKTQYHSGGGIDNIFFLIALVFLIAVVVSIGIAAYIFSKKVSRPVSLITEDIKDLSEGKPVSDTGPEKGLFKDALVSVGRLQTALEENEKTRKQWVPNISHDIRTPLSSIKGYAEVLAESGYSLEEAEIKDYAKEILNASDVIEGLAEDLKMYQSLVEGNCHLNLQKVNIRKILDECIAEASAGMKEKDDIKLYGESDVFVTADEKLIKRSLVNIMCNSFIHNSNPVNVAVDYEANEDCLSISISDNGKGLTEDEKNHLFERYYRGMGTDKIKGTGLGMSIANEVIQAHGGTINVESSSGKGVKFVIELKGVG